MIMDPYLNEYEVSLSDGERIKVSELDEEILYQIKIPCIAASLASLLDRCTLLTRDQTEALKMGHDQPFRSAIRSPVVGLMKVTPSLCRIRNNCVMYQLSECTLKNIKKNSPKFPTCFEYDFVSKLTGENLNFVILLGNCIVHAWRTGRYVILVRG